MLIRVVSLRLYHEIGKMSRVVRKPDFYICENKDADQLHGNCEAHQRLCFRYTASSIPLLPKSEISSLWPSSVAVQPGLYQTWSETPKTGFLGTRLKLSQSSSNTHLIYSSEFYTCPIFESEIPMYGTKLTIYYYSIIALKAENT